MPVSNFVWGVLLTVVCLAVFLPAPSHGVELIWKNPKDFSLVSVTTTSIATSRSRYSLKNWCFPCWDDWFSSKQMYTPAGGSKVTKSGTERDYTWSDAQGGTQYTVDLELDSGGGSKYTASLTATTPCPVGQGQIAGGGGCELCPLGKYSGLATELGCNPCPTGKTTSVPGATALSDCVCPVGTFWTGSVCDPCGVDTYKAVPGDSVDLCVACPAGSSTLGGTGGTSMGACSCPLGTQASPLAPSPTPFTCEDCPANTYQDVETSTQLCTVCPTQSGTNGATASTQASDCLCPPGMEGPPNACTFCGVGTFKSDWGPGPCSPCPAGSSTATTQSTSAAECTVCLSGYWGAPCVPCESGCAYACDDGALGSGKCTCDNSTGLLAPECTACSTSWFGSGCDARCTCQRGVCSSGASGTGTCLSCDLGWDGVNCDVCAAGFTVSSSCTRCQAGWARTLADPQCRQCPPGSFKELDNSGRECSPCPRGEYQPSGGSGACLSCPAGTYADVEGSTTTCSPCGLGLTSPPGSVSADACTPCPAGTYKDIEGAGGCTACPGDTTTVAPEPDKGATSLQDCGCTAGLSWNTDETCTPCDAAAGAASPELARAPCMPCPEGSLFAEVDQPCLGCPFGAYCAGGTARPVAGFGYFPVGTDTYLGCTPPDVCLGDGRCLKGHRGLRCALCSSGYFKNPNSGKCEVCPDNIKYIFLGLGVAAFIGGIILVRIARSAHGYFTAASIGFSFLQIISILSSFSRLKWPHSVSSFLTVLSAVNADLQLFKPECLVSDTSKSYYVIWGIKLASPLFMLLVFLMAWVLVWAYSKVSLALQERYTDSIVPVLTLPARRMWKYAFVNSSVTTQFLLYLMVTNTAMEIFPCSKQPDGRYAMDREPSILCYTATWFRLMGVSLSVLVGFSLAMPLIIGTILFRRRESLWKRKNQAKYGLLFARYRPTFFLWELAIVLRKFGVVFGKILFSQSVVGQVVFAWAVVALSFVAQVRFAPYASTRINSLESLMLILAEIVLSLAIVFAAADGKLNSTASGALATFVISAIVIACIILAIAIILEIRKTYRLKRRGIVGKFAIDKVDADKLFFDRGIGIQLLSHVQTEDSIVLTFATDVHVSLGAQIALEKQFRHKSEVDRSVSSYFSWCTDTGSGSRARGDLSGAYHPQFQGQTPMGLYHELRLNCPVNGYYGATLLLIDGGPIRAGSAAAAAGVGSDLTLWQRFSRFIDGSGSRAFAPEVVRLIMTNGSQRLISLRLTMSPEWSARDSMAGNVQAVDTPTDAVSLTAPGSRSLDTRMVTFSEIDLPEDWDATQSPAPQHL